MILRNRIVMILSGIALVSLTMMQACAVEKTAKQQVKGKSSHQLRSMESKLAKFNNQKFGENVIFANGFEEGQFQFLGGGRPTDIAGPMWAQAQFQNPDYAAKFVSQPTRTGNKAIRFEWRTSGLAKSNTSKKAMIHYGKSPASLTTDRWYGFSVYVPSKELALEKKYHVLIFQLHASPDHHLKEPWRVPPVSMALRDGGLRFWHTFDHDQVSPKNDNIRPNGKAHTVCKQEEMWGRWTDVVVHTKFSLEKKGIAQVWINGKQALDIHGIDLGYNDEIGPYPSWGLYSYKGPESRVIYFDEISIGNENAGYVDVAPGRSDNTQKPLQD